MSERMPTPGCPRCGYDQSGEIAAWKEACPLEGVCTECGLRITWGQILNPELAAPTWLFEHARWRRALAYPRTLIRVLLPWLLWRLPLATPVRGRALCALVLISLAATHLVLWITTAWLISINAIWWGGPGWLGALSGGAWPYDPIVRTYWREYPLNWLEVLGVLLVPILTSAAFLLLVSTFGKMKLRRIHLARGAVYWYVALPVFWLLLAVAWSYDEGAISLPRNLDWRVREYELIHFMGVIGGLMLLWHVAYWYAFTRGYLRLPHAAGVAAAAVVIGVTGSSVVCLLAYIVAVAIAF